MWKFNKTIKTRLTNDANYQQQLWEKIVRFWSLTKKTRNSDSLTSEFHSGCKKGIDYLSISIWTSRWYKNPGFFWNSYQFLLRVRSDIIHNWLRIQQIWDWRFRKMPHKFDQNLKHAPWRKLLVVGKTGTGIDFWHLFLLRER